MGQFCFLLRYLQQPQKRVVLILPDHGREVQSRGGLALDPPPVHKVCLDSFKQTLMTAEDVNSWSRAQPTAGIRAGVILEVSLVHDALQNGGEWCDADACPDQDGMLGGKDLSCRSPVRSIYITLKCSTESVNEYDRSSQVLTQI